MLARKGHIAILTLVTASILLAVLFLNSHEFALAVDTGNWGTIRFVEPAETVNDSDVTFKDGAVFVWTPNDSTNNAILSITVYFQYRCEVVNPMQWRMEIDGNPSGAIQWLYSATYAWSPTYMDSYIETAVDGHQRFDVVSYPNRFSYTIKFQFATNNGGMDAYVKDINVILTVADGMIPNEYYKVELPSSPPVSEVTSTELLMILGLTVAILYSVYSKSKDKFRRHNSPNQKTLLEYTR